MAQSPDNNISRLKVILRDVTTSDGNSRRVVAYIDDHGDLVLETFDTGPNVEAAWGHDDYEFSRRVAAELVPKVLLELIRDRFDSERNFQLWLEQKGIPGEFSSWP